MKCRNCGKEVHMMCTCGFCSFCVEHYGHEYLIDKYDRGKK